MPLSPTAATHLAFLAVIAAYLGLSYPAGLAAVAVQLSLAVVSEVLHGGWPTAQRLMVLREALFLLGLAAAWLIGTPLYPLVGMALCGSLLLLVRHRALRFLPALCAADLVWCGVRGAHGAPDAAMVLVPLAVAALAADAWLAGQSGARSWVRRSRRRRLPGWSWLAAPVLVCAAVGLLLGLPAAQRPQDEQPVQPLTMASPKVAANSGLSNMLRVGDQVHIERDQHIAARLEWIGAPPKVGRMVYLRAIALPHVISEGPFLLWRAADGNYQPLHARIPANAPSGWLLRKPGGADAVLHPDGCAGVGLDHLLRDADGNWYRAGLGREATVYRVSLEKLNDPELDEALVGEVDTSRRVPRELSVLPWEQLERPAWAAQPAEDAARDIIELIQKRCHYELEHLPEPDPSPGGALRTFLFSEDPDDRRGHCQYFATAAVIMLRRAGHPARTVVGFASEEQDATGVTFRGIHAHAWLEVVNSRGRWQRFDATPAAGYLERISGLDPLRSEVASPVAPATMPGEPGGEHADDGETTAAVPGLHLSLRTIRWLGIVVLAGLLCAWAWARWRARPSPRGRRLAALAQANASLYACARELGLPVRPSSTLALVAEALSRRTGIDLAVHLREHLAARYGTGAPPRPWPLAELRAAGQSRST